MNRQPSPPSRQLDRSSFLYVAAGVACALLPVLPGFPLWLSALLLGVVAIGTRLGLRGRKLPAALRLPVTILVALAAVLGAGLSMSQETGATLLAAMLASKLLETDTVRDGRSACSFALFSIMAGFLRDQGPLTLLLALQAAIVLLAALQRLARIQFPEQPIPSPRPWLALGGSLKLLAASLPFAFVVFFLFPRFPDPLWGAPAPDDRSRSGLSNDMSPGDIVEMLLDDSPALRVTFEGQPPPRDAMYWRGPVLSEFDGRRWSRWSGDGFANPAPLEQRTPTLFQEVMQEPTSNFYLIGLDVPVDVPENARIGMDRTVFARPTSSVRRYRIGSAVDYTFEPVLPETTRRRHLRLPPGNNPRTAELIARWQAEDSAPDALIRRALELFHSQFSYTLTPPPLARDSVDDFLFNTRAGYCEHFASAFAVMMRAGGVPARVVTGYQGGTFNRVGAYWLVRNSDAHAWTEVWLEDRGWLRIDPTSAVAPERIQQGLSGVVPEAGAFTRWSQPLWEATDALRRGWNFVIVDFDASRQRALFSRLGLDPQDWRQIGLALTIGIALAVGLSFILLRRTGPKPVQDPLLMAWQRFCTRLALSGMVKHPGETPYAFAARASTALPSDAAIILALTQGYVAHRYAGPESRPELGQLIQQLRRFRPSPSAPGRTS